MSKPLVIVESPTKVKTISKILGSGYEVKSSVGHIRDLPSKNGSVDPDNQFKMIWIFVSAPPEADKISFSDCFL